jgi:hypothetical protein
LAWGEKGNPTLLIRKGGIQLAGRGIEPEDDSRGIRRAK